MRKIKILLISALAVLFACSDDYININSLEHSEGLNLWWGHKFFGENGRGYIFSFTEKKREENSYDLEFKYKIDNKKKKIHVYLENKLDNGPCHIFPNPNGNDGLCFSSGSIFITEDELANESYDFIVQTADYTEHSIFKIEEGKTTLKIPDNDFFSASVTEVFPSPKNLLYGIIEYRGEDKANKIQQFLSVFEDDGFEKATVANPPFNLTVDENKQPILQFVEPDRYYQGFLFQLNKSFDRALQITRGFFNQNEINITLFTTNGDQAFFSKQNGITIQYGHN